MRVRSLMNLGVAGAAVPDGLAATGCPVPAAADAVPDTVPDGDGRLAGTATALVTPDDRAAERGGRVAVGLKFGSEAAAATFSADVFMAEAKASVSSQVGGREAIGAAGCGVGWGAGVTAAGVAGRDAEACFSNISTSSGPGGVGAWINAGSGSGGRPSSESKNFFGPREAGGAASGRVSHGCDTAKAIASRQTTARRRHRG